MLRCWVKACDIACSRVFQHEKKRKRNPDKPLSRLAFDRDGKNYELWETKFLGHLYLQELKETILSESFEEDTVKNAEAYAELI